MGRGWMLCFALLPSCSEQVSFNIDAPWPSDRVVVLVEHNEREEPVAARAFAPGAPIVLSADGGQRVGLTAITYPPTDVPELDPVLCGVTLDRTNPIALLPDAAFRAPTTDWAESGAPSFQAIDPGSLDIPLGYKNCTTDPFDCSQLDLEKTVGTHAEGKVRTIVAVDDDLIFYGASTAPDSLANNFHLYRAFLPRGEAAEQRELPFPPELSFRNKSLTFDGSVILGRNEDGAAFFATPDGTLTYTSSIADYKIVASRAGLTFELGRAGARCLGCSIPPILVPSFAIAIVAIDRIAVVTASGIEYWDGQRWTLEYRLGSGKGWSIGGDADVLVAVQTDGEILERNDADRTWETQGPLLGSNTDLRGAVGLGGGRWMIPGQDGLIGIKLARGGRVCLAPVLGPNNYEALALSPSGRTVWLGMSPNASVPGDHALLVRVTLPGRP